MRRSVDGEILVPAPVGLLNPREKTKDVERRARIARGKKSHGGVIEVAGPDHVVAADPILAVLGFRDAGIRKGCDDRSPMDLVLMHLDHFRRSPREWRELRVIQ